MLKPSYQRPSACKAFTLIELLVVVAIIALLISILIPSLAVAKDLAKKSACGATLKGLGTACFTYETAEGCLPPGYVATGAYADGATDTSPGWGWPAFLLPYASGAAVATQINFKLPIEDPANAAGVATLMKPYICPADIVPVDGFVVDSELGAPMSPGVVAGPSSYVGICGGDETDVSAPSGTGAFYRNSGTKIASITDGASNTMLLGERAWTAAQGLWAGAINGGFVQRGPTNPNPGTSSLEPPGFVLAHGHLINCLGDTDGGLDDMSSNHPGGADVLLADGSVHFFRSVPLDNGTVSGTNPNGYSQDSLYLQAYATIANGDGAGDLER